MIDKEIFLSSCYLDENDIEKANVTWDELDLIQADYSELERHLRELGKEFIDTYLYEIDKAGIHSYRYRVKSSAHLLEKVIRKKKENPEKFAVLDHTNYHKMVTDLVGIRVFFLYREDWINFHNYITNVFENNPKNYIEDRLEDFDDNVDHYYIAEKPKAYKRAGDTRIYDSDMLDIKSDGIYRSIHYIIKYKGYYIEIQGRTLFEEGWAEIDHDIVYPFYQDDEMLKDFSKLLNRLAGSADEMSSYFRKMKQNKEEK